MQSEAWAAAKVRRDAEKRAAERQWELRGNNGAVQTLDDPEILLVGAAGTGKTLAILAKLDRVMRAYPGARALIVRKVRADLAQSTLVTFERDILGLDNPICAGVQRESRQSYKYPNGSEVAVGGMDRPGRILSSEYDLIYAAEAVQFALEDWETFGMRIGRTATVPYPQLIGDTNPDRPDHWLKQRCDAGTTRLLNTTHQDNPALWDLVAGDWTALGRKYVLGRLAALSSVRRARFFEGKWVLAEGAVYDDWDEKIHVVDRFEIPPGWRRIRVVDFGFVNPFVCIWLAIDPDGRLFLYREIYRTQRLVEDHARRIVELSKGEKIEATIADHDAEDRATLRRHGVSTIAALKEISVGIQAVQARLRVQGDGRARLFVFRDALVEADPQLVEEKRPTCTREEFPGYVWAKTPDGKPDRETPLDLDNHGMDVVRYGVRYVDHPRTGRIGPNPLY